jgi:PEP-CTERM motif
LIFLAQGSEILWSSSSYTLEDPQQNFIVAAVVPEPATLVLAGLAGVCGVAIYLAGKLSACRMVTTSAKASAGNCGGRRIL